MRVSFVLLSSVALALKLPVAVQPPSAVRCLPPIMEIPMDRTGQAQQGQPGMMNTDRTGSVEPTNRVAAPPVVLVQGKVRWSRSSDLWVVPFLPLLPCLVAHPEVAGLKPCATVPPHLVVRAGAA